MRITNRCKAPLDVGFVKRTNKATGERISKLTIRRSRGRPDAKFHAYKKDITGTSHSEVVIVAPENVTTETLSEWWGHELAEVLLSCGDKEIVCDGFVMNLLGE